MKSRGDGATIKTTKSGWLAQCRNCGAALAKGSDDIMYMPLQGVWWFDEAKAIWRPTKGHRKRRQALRHVTDNEGYQPGMVESHWAAKQRFILTDNFTRKKWQLPDEIKRDTNGYSNLLPTKFECVRCSIESSISVDLLNLNRIR